MAIVDECEGGGVEELVRTGSVAAAFTGGWEFDDGQSGWKPLAQEAQALVEAAYAAGEPTVQVSYRAWVDVSDRLWCVDTDQHNDRKDTKATEDRVRLAANADHIHCVVEWTARHTIVSFLQRASAPFAGLYAASYHFAASVQISHARRFANEYSHCSGVAI